MAVYLEGQTKSPDYVRVVKGNIAQMKAWAAEGK